MRSNSGQGPELGDLWALEPPGDSPCPLEHGATGSNRPSPGALNLTCPPETAVSTPLPRALPAAPGWLACPTLGSLALGTSDTGRERDALSSDANTPPLALLGLKSSSNMVHYIERSGA